MNPIRIPDLPWRKKPGHCAPRRKAATIQPP